MLVGAGGGVVVGEAVRGCSAVLWSVLDGGGVVGGGCSGTAGGPGVLGGGGTAGGPGVCWEVCVCGGHWWP